MTCSEIGVPDNKDLFSGRVLDNKNLFSGRVPDNKKILSGRFTDKKFIFRKPSGQYQIKLNRKLFEHLPY